MHRKKFIGLTQRFHPYGQFGLTILHVHFDDYSHEIALHNYACKRGAEAYGAAISAIRTLLASPHPLKHNLRTDLMLATAQELLVNRQNHPMTRIYSYPRLMYKSG